MRKLLLLTFAAALAGCPAKPQYPECKVDQDCADHGQVCIGGFCKECRDDKDCASHPDRPVCKDAACVAKGACSKNEDCAAGQKCLGGRCAGQDECLADADCGSGRSCVDKVCKAQEISSAQKLTTGCEPKVVYFGFDDASITADARKGLDEEYQCLQRGQFQRVAIAGHADERGTTEYNLALGERRANAVKKYLAGLGADAGRLKAISYGKERPADPGHNEAAWSKNRRVEIVVEQ